MSNRNEKKNDFYKNQNEKLENQRYYHSNEELEKLSFTASQIGIQNIAQIEDGKVGR